MGTKFNEQIDQEGQEEALEAKENQEELQDELDGEDTPEDTSASEDADDEPEEDESEEDESEEDEVVDDEITEQELEGLKRQKELLSKQVVELRKERRTMREQDKDEVFVDKPVDLTDVADSDVELIEKVITAKGYVKKEDQYKEQLSSYKDQWLADNPEYLPENDPDDVLWNKLKAEMGMYKTPAKPKDIVKILNRINKEINPKATIPVKSRAKTQAAKKKIETSSKGGGGKGKSASAPKTKPTVDRSALSGFTDEELDEMGL